MNGYHWRLKCVSLLMAVLLFAVSAGAALARENADQENKLSGTLLQYVGQLNDNPLSEGITAGFEVYSLDQKKMIASYNGEKTFVPASVFKLLVTSAAVSLWPENMRLPTKVYLQGHLSDGGVLNGNVILKGFGDPTLTVDQLNTLAKSLTDKGVHKVNGNLIVDESYFDTQRLGDNWMWDDEPYDYNTQMSALSVRENTVDVGVFPTHAGEAPKITVDPAPEYVQVINRAKTVEGSGSNLTIDRTRGTNEIVVTGTIGQDDTPGYKDTRTIDNPALFTGTVFHDLLAKQGIIFQPRSRIVTGEAGSDAQIAAEVFSPNLDDILRSMDKVSDNFYAEMLTKQLGAQKMGKGSTEAGIQVIDHFLENQLGVDVDFAEKDGSGLSRLDHISPHTYTQLLSAMYQSSARDRFISFLPIAGVDGTLKNRMKNTAAAGNVKAKTGSMSGVNSLVGYVTGANGEKFVFSILTNGIYKSVYARNLQDKIAVALANYPNIPEPDYTPPVPASYPLSEQLDPILNDLAYKGVIKGALVYSTNQKKILYAQNPNALLTPDASVKLLTSASALNQLGSGYRFRTEVYTEGSVEDGVLNGNIILKGYGDPTIAEGSRVRMDGALSMEQIASDIRKAGIHQVLGHVLVDSSFYSDDVYAPGWTWDHESDPIQPQITALSVNQGTVRLDYSPGHIGKNINLTMEPEDREIQIINEAVTGKTGTENMLKITRDRGKNIIRVSGVLPVDHQPGFRDVAIERPEIEAGYALSEQLRQAGVHLNPQNKVESIVTPGDAERIKTYNSPYLSDIIRYMNHSNNNFTSEMILRTLGTINNGQGTFDQGVQRIYQSLSSLNVPTLFDLDDGSGLSRYNQMSAAQIVDLLSAEKTQPEFPSFYDSLPALNETGSSSKTRLTGISGDQPDIQTLSGYVKTDNGDWIAYSLLLNGAGEEPLKSLSDHFAQTLTQIADH
ncbi:D-alanyl-D-alanine carboxypeptidase/D-alanyl-D-alanine-endopeptidase [Sporolactobacillus sp. THM7-4]|nr:D-alanyl-D-alanine carboxypeptidase/D-alanyl-D-alanine-endopeptidase [Sporolactobacillus sp. THM7-4]